jgi:cytochrome b subunit of formate dehydrogenase/nitrate/TMAO reductase-like tetraheme cytochrome c subunit
MSLALKSPVFWLEGVPLIKRTKSTSRAGLTWVFAAGIFILQLAANTDVLAQENEECLSCHQESGLTMTRRGKEISLSVDPSGFKASAHGDLTCVSCHVGFNPTELPHAKRIRPVDCTSCHSEEQVTSYGHSVHAAVKNGTSAATCADCHTAHEIKKVSALSINALKKFELQACEKCHADVKTQFMVSDHGEALTAGIEAAPSCVDCHGAHNVLASKDDSSRTSRKNLVTTCLGCHVDKQEVRDRVGPSVAFIASYESSVHGRAVQNGNDSAAVCIDCHGTHDIRKGSDPQSGVARDNIAETCGKCHTGIFKQYSESIHGKAFASGVTAAATCTDCHGEHNILSPKDIRSPVAARNVSVEVCSPCHASVKLEKKYGLAAGVFQSYSDSYHGLAGRAGDVEVANCASCHGVHDIKPSSDPTSRINKNNLAKTCGTCHPGANVNFARGRVHVIATSGSEEVLYLVSTSYIILIALVIGGMFLHNFLDFIKKSKRQLAYRRGMLKREPVPHRLYLRMSLSERIQHGTLLASFFILVLTGFALKFPDAWWVVPIRDISPFMFEARGILHRVAGVILVVAGLYHLYYVFFVPRGKQLLRDLVPVRQDLVDAIKVMQYNLGFASEKPKFGRFSYIEKSEYWALVWGTVVMGITGVILWFDNTFIGLLTKLWWDVAQTVHYYEAWLATLAIVVWHFYYVIFNPDTYPINLSFWKGTLTEEEMQEEHPLELEKLEKERAQIEAADEHRS